MLSAGNWFHAPDAQGKWETFYAATESVRTIIQDRLPTDGATWFRTNHESYDLRIQEVTMASISSALGVEDNAGIAAPRFWLVTRR